MGLFVAMWAPVLLVVAYLSAHAAGQDWAKGHFSWAAFNAACAAGSVALATAILLAAANTPAGAP